jgi:hypothetical protein
MDQTRKMWASVVVVGVIIAGGASVAAAASAGKLEQVGRETRAVVEKASPSSQPPEQPARSPETSDDSPTDGRDGGPDGGIVVSTEVNPDPGAVIEYWTDKRMEDAQPMPMPEVSPGELGGTE